MEKSTDLVLRKTANAIRKNVLRGVFNAQSGHIGGSFSVADVLAYLYFRELRIDPQNPQDPTRDRLVLSKGHCAPALYSALALRGFFDIGEMERYRQMGSMLQGHPDKNKVPGIDMSSGSLGQGISAAVGIALNAKIDKSDYRVYAVLGDGELEEGQVWESAMFAARYKLDNLTAIIDNNGLQIDEKVEDVMSGHPIADRFKAFGWVVFETDGHDFASLEKVFEDCRKAEGIPHAVVAHTVKGRGVSFMENNLEWHGSPPNAEQYELAMRELDALQATLEANGI
ncbi:MAG: transketolase [Synergistaceae bacterium]|jgi:transketolase|nr:transketolase [Synergistaceae bacterium]